MASVDFYFDYGSPASHLAFFELQSIAQEVGASIVWRPILLGAAFKAIGSHSPADIPAKMRWMFEDLTNYARRYRIPFVRNPYFVINTLPLMRGALVAEQRGELVAYSTAMFCALWRDGRNMGDGTVIATVLDENKLDRAAYLAGVEQPAIKDELKRRTGAAVERGVFGVPTFFVGERMWWGQDRLDWVRDALCGSES